MARRLFTTHAVVAEWAKSNVLDHDNSSMFDKVYFDLEAFGNEVKSGDVIFGDFPQSLVKSLLNLKTHVFSLEWDSNNPGPAEWKSIDDCKEAQARFIGWRLGVDKEPERAPIHVMLVSEQLLPNLIPLMQDWRTGGVTLAVVAMTKEMGKSAGSRRIQYLIKKEGIPVLGVSANAAFVDGNTLVGNKLRKQLAKQYPGCPVTLNITGGTKPMSIGYYEAFKDTDNVSIVYVDTADRRIIHFENEAKEPFPSVINLPLYLAAFGFRLAPDAWPLSKKRAKAIRDRQTLTFWLCNEFSNGNKGTDLLLRPLNRLMKLVKAQCESFYYKKNEKVMKWNANFVALEGFEKGEKSYARFLPLLSRLSDDKLIKLEGDPLKPEKIRIGDSQATYLSGAWLEEYAWLSANNARDRFDAGAEVDIAIGLEGIWEDSTGKSASQSKTGNELDLVLVYNNQILVVEAKARIMTDAGVGQEIANKLDALGKRVGGPFARRWLISAQTVPPHLSERAQLYRIDIIQGQKELSQLENLFLKWMNDVKSK